MTDLQTKITEIQEGFEVANLKAEICAVEKELRTPMPILRRDELNEKLTRLQKELDGCNTSMEAQLSDAGFGSAGPM